MGADRVEQGRRSSVAGLPVVLAVLGVLGCEPGPVPAASPSPESTLPFAARFDVDGVYQLDGSSRLAHRGRPIRDALKADEFDDARAVAPELHAITGPPAAIANVRPMVEWEPMRALMFAFPAATAQYSQVSDTFVNIARHASAYGEVWVLVDGAQAETIFRDKLARAGVLGEGSGTSIKLWRTQLDTHWLVDYGPLPIIDAEAGTYAFADFRYYHRRPIDDALPTLLGRSVTRFGEPLPVTTYRMPLTTEGGTFQATSDGVCFTSSRQIYNMSCLAGACRESIVALPLEDLQAHPYAIEMRTVLAGYVGCKDLLVTHSISDDGTGHLDMYLKVLDDSRLLLGEYRRPFDNAPQEMNAALMDDNAAFLEAYVKPDGTSFQVVRMPMPGHRTVQDIFDRYEVPFTYLNSTFFNGLNLWPAYRFSEWSASRAEAEAIWRQVLPDMEHVWIDSEELSYMSGAIHCVTRTVPRMKPRPWVDDGACDGGVCGGVEGGYDGACALAGATDLCWGPDWLCGCNDCRACPEELPEGPCEHIGWSGCCEGGDVVFCEDARVKRVPCAGTGCGWDAAASYYDCGLSGEDPTREHPISCACEPRCDGRTCGDDGCGGSCGTCPDGARCVAGRCRTDCADCTPGALGCTGAVAWRCVEGVDGCHGRAQVDCSDSGRTCGDGACVSVPTPDADPEPVPVEAEVEPTLDALDAPDASGEAADAAAEPAVAPPRAGDPGCSSGRSGAWIPLLGWLLAGRLTGRRRAFRA